MSGLDWSEAAAAADGAAEFAPATAERIASAEARLGIALPPSYLAFVRVSDGWRRPAASPVAVKRVRGVTEVEWFRKRNRAWVDAYTGPMTGGGTDASDEEYFSYGQWAADYRPAHLKETLQVSDVGDAAVYLLNPQVIWRDGEWEAWFLANWLPGVVRYRSFGEMMEAEYRTFATDAPAPAAGPVGDLPDEYVGSPGSSKRKVKPRRPSEVRPPVEAMIAAISDPAAARRLFPRAARASAAMDYHGVTPERAVWRKLATELGRSRDPRAVDALMDRAGREDDPWVVEEILAALGASRDVRAAAVLEPLARAGDTHAMQALAKLAPERAAEPLLDLIARRDEWFVTAAMWLGQIGEARAVPLLVAVAKEAEGRESNACPGDVQMASKMLAGFGRAGFEALVELSRPGGAATVRLLATHGLYYTKEADARAVLEGLADDPDDAIRAAASLGLSILPKRRGR